MSAVKVYIVAATVSVSADFWYESMISIIRIVRHAPFQSDKGRYGIFEKRYVLTILEVASLSQ